MTISRIDNSLLYAELKGVNPNDVKRETKLYQIMLFDLNVIITVGGAKSTTKNITYYPIYLVKSNNNVLQIGVYEILTSKLDKYIHPKTKDLLVEKMGEPLIYTYVSKGLVW
jgi:hypothetical protein